MTQHVIDIPSIATQLQNALTPTEIAPLLHSLTSVEVPLQTLIDTKLGRTVKKLAKHDDSRVASDAGLLLKKWASQIDPVEVETNKRKLSLSTSNNDVSSSGNAVATATTASTPTPSTTTATENSESVAKRAKLTKSTSSAATNATSTTTSTPASSTTAKSSSQESDGAGGGSVRDRAVTMLTDALTRQTDSATSTATATTTATAAAGRSSSTLSTSDDQIVLNDFESEPLSVATQIEVSLIVYFLFSIPIY